MKPILITVLCLMFLPGMHGQTDVWPTSNGMIKMTPIFHGALVLQYMDKTIYIDPYGGAGRYSTLPAPDFVLITHPHPDHLDPSTLKGLDLSHAELIAPPSVVDQIKDVTFVKVTVMDNTGGANREGIQIEAVPMYNLPDDENAHHHKGVGNGYLITIDGKRIYISGDTGDIPEMRSLQNIDYAFVCMNLPYTMTVEQAADAVMAFKPKVVYPYHYRGNNGLSDIKEFSRIVSGNPNIQVRLRDWYQAL